MLGAGENLTQADAEHQNVLRSEIRVARSSVRKSLAIHSQSSPCVSHSVQVQIYFSAQGTAKSESRGLRLEMVRPETVTSENSSDGAGYAMGRAHTSLLGGDPASAGGEHVVPPGCGVSASGLLTLKIP